MKLFEYDDFPDILIKFSEKREYLDDIINGKIYMNESGYFRKLEDNFRGDVNDGKCPIDLSRLKGGYFEIKPTDGSSDGIKMPFENIGNIIVGFHSDDKIPLFCCSQVNERILEQEERTVIKFKKEFCDEMKKFGKYFLIFHGREFLNNIVQYSESKNIGVQWGSVTYENIYETYSISLLGDKSRNPYDPFFKKDLSYQLQNEWRLLLASTSDTPLIDDVNSHYIANITPLTWNFIGETSQLDSLVIGISETEDAAIVSD